MLNNITITKCDVIDIITEGHRFLIHIFLVGLLTNLMDTNTNEIITSTLLKTLLATVIALIIYHVIIKKQVEGKLKNLRKICDSQTYE